MPLFSSRTPEERVEEAAFKAAWKVLEPVQGLSLEQATLDAAWNKALPAGKAADSGKPPLGEDVTRHHANRGFRQAWTLWNERVMERRATKRRVIVESGHDVAADMMATITSEEEVSASVERAYYAAYPAAEWLNDGMFALAEEEFARAVYEGAQEAADERVAQLAGGARELGGGGRSPDGQRAFDLATDAARFSAAGALAAGSETDPAAGEAVAMDAAAAAVESLPDEVRTALADDDVLAAAVRGAGEALGEQGMEPAPGAAVPPNAERAAHPAGAAAGAPRAPGHEPARTPTPPSAARRAAASAGGFIAGAGSRVRPAAGRAADSAKLTGYRLVVARKVKGAVDPKLPEADGYGLSQPESDRVYAAARMAALAANQDLGTPFTDDEAERLGKMTAGGIVATWYAVGHIKRSGATEALTGAARDTALRYLRTTPLPASLVEYLVDEAIRVATPGWAKPGGDERWADKAAEARRRLQPTTFRGRPVPNYYELLQVSPKADSIVIEKAWRALIATAHPDLGGDPERARQMNEAREVLLDPVARKQFDEENGF